MVLVWATLTARREAPWDGLLAPLTFGQGTFSSGVIFIIAPWVAVLWGPRSLLLVGAVAGGAAWAFWARVVDGIGV
jgi:hypothetical protein